MLSHLSLTIWWGGYYSSFTNLRNLRGGTDTNLHLSEVKVHMHLWKYEAKGEETVTTFLDVVPTSYETRVMLWGWRIPDGNLNSRWSDLACGLEGSAENEPGANRQGVPAGAVSSPPPRTPVPLVSAAPPSFSCHHHGNLRHCSVTTQEVTPMSWPPRFLCSPCSPRASQESSPT